MPTAFLIVSVIGALFTINAYRPLARRGPFSIVAFFCGWLTSELPVHHIVWQVAATVVFVVGGALDGWQGWVGLALTVVSWVGLANLVREAEKADEIVEQALADTFGDDYRDRILHELVQEPDAKLARRQLWLPLWRKHPMVQRTRNIAYGPAGK